MKGLLLHKPEWGQGTAPLPFATDVTVIEELNGEYYVTFKYLRSKDDHRYDMLVDGAEVRFPPGIERGQRFIVRKVREVRERGKLYKLIEAHHIAFKLNQYFLDGYVDFAANKPITYPVEMIGNNTPFSFTIEGNFDSKDLFEFGEDNKMTLLDSVCELYEAERSFDNYTINVTTRVGANHHMAIRYRKNLKGLTRTSHSLERITRLYGYGKNGLTIEGYGGRTVKYVDSQYYDPAEPYEAKVEFPDIDDQARLYDAMLEYLRKHELPKVSYDIDFVELEKTNLQQDMPYEINRIRSVGDTVRVVDEVLGVDVLARVQRFERYPFAPKSGRVVLTNFRELTAADYVSKALYSGQKAITYTSRNGVLKGVKYDESITLVDGMGMAVSDDIDRIRVRLGQVAPGDYGLTAYNKAGNKTLWLDANTGDAQFSGTITAGTINGSNMNGGTISGTNIFGSYIATSASYPRVEMSTSANLFGAYQTANNYARLTPLTALSGNVAPGIEMKQGSGELAFGYGAGSLGGFGIYSSGIFEVQAMGGLYVNNLNVPDWNYIYGYSIGGGQSLQSALDGKADKSTVNASLSALQSRVQALEAAVGN